MGGFDRLIQTTKGHLPFHFCRVYSVTGVRYIVSVMEKAHKFHLFYMVNHSEEWHIVVSRKIPNWIKAVESKLHSAIMNQ